MKVPLPVAAPLPPPQQPKRSGPSWFRIAFWMVGGGLVLAAVITGLVGYLNGRAQQEKIDENVRRSSELEKTLNRLKGGD